MASMIQVTQLERIPSQMKAITIITATLNSEKHIHGLIDSLAKQSTKDYEWIVADGGSTDETVGIILKATMNRIRVRLLQQNDHGIYDALNKAIQVCTTSHYLVVGSDDRLDHRAVEIFSQHIRLKNADLIVASIRTNNGKTVRPTKKPAWLHGHKSFISEHAVGVAIKTSLHDSCGLYSSRFPIAADQLFILRCISNHASIDFQDFIAGEYNAEDGVSSRDILGRIMESCRVQIEMGYGTYLQLSILLIRILRNCTRLGKHYSGVSLPK